MSVLSAEEQALLEWLKSSIPRWFWMDDTTRSQQEVWAGVVKSLIRVQQQGESWNLATYILNAEGVWLNQHAKDRGTGRQEDETDEALRERLRTFADVVTPPSIVSLVNTILEAEGITEDCALVELPQHGAHSGTYVMDSGTAGTFTKDGNTMTFSPWGDTGDPYPWDGTPMWAGPIYRGSGLQPSLTAKLVFSGAGNAGNNGTFTVTGVDENAAVYTNPAGVAGDDFTETAGIITGGVSWELHWCDPEGNNRMGWARAYSQRGYRSARIRPGRFIIILPFGATAATAASVNEALREKKAGGFATAVERRLIAP